MSMQTNGREITMSQAINEAISEVALDFVHVAYGASDECTGLRCVVIGKRQILNFVVNFIPYVIRHVMREPLAKKAIQESCHTAQQAEGHHQKTSGQHVIAIVLFDPDINHVAQYHWDSNT